MAPRLAAADDCWPGSAPGRWDAPSSPYDWVLRNSSCRPLRRFVFANASRCEAPVPAVVPRGSPTQLPSCGVRDEALFRSLGNTSVLLVGDSTSAQLLWHACETHRQPPQPFVPVHGPEHEALNKSMLRWYHHRLRSLDNHYCRLRAGRAGRSGREASVLLGSFSHYGILDPPYWRHAYPFAPWLANNSYAMVREDMTKFAALNGGDPALIVASSGFWDIAALWATEGAASPTWHATAAHAAVYAARVRRFVGVLARTFPRSTVVWRLMHAGQKHSVTPAVVTLFNDAVRAEVAALGVPLVNAEAMMAAVSAKTHPDMPFKGYPYGTADGMHLHGWLNLALLNVILNAASWVADAHESGRAPSPRRAPARTRERWSGGAEPERRPRRGDRERSSKA